MGGHTCAHACLMAPIQVPKIGNYWVQLRVPKTKFSNFSNPDSKKCLGKTLLKGRFSNFSNPGFKNLGGLEIVTLVALNLTLMGCSALQMAPGVAPGLQMAPDGYRWLQMVPDGSRWHRLMAPDGSRWLQMAPVWLQMTPDGTQYDTWSGGRLNTTPPPPRQKHM